MADPWLQLQVLRELHEARARYFAVTLHSASSREYLEIPASFFAETGWPQEEECALVTSISAVKEWPLRFRRLPDMHSGITATSVSGGWSRFVADQNLGIGAFLTFEVVDDRRLVVSLHRRSDAPDYGPAIKPEFPVNLLRDRSDREAPEVGHCATEQSSAVPCSHCDNRPHFQKTLRKTHKRRMASSKLDVPTAYWRTYGQEQFDGISCTLNGPLAAWTVQTAVLKYASQTFCSFTQGWAGFCTANNLKIGDTLIFTKVGFDEFQVRKAS